MAFVRECRRCHSVDLRERFERDDDPAARIASGGEWRCPHCGGGEFDLVPAASVGGG